MDFQYGLQPSYLCSRHEMGVIRDTSFVRGILLSSVQFSIKISIFISIVVYVLLGNKITAEKVSYWTS